MGVWVYFRFSWPLPWDRMAHPWDPLGCIIRFRGFVRSDGTKDGFAYHMFRLLVADALTKVYEYMPQGRSGNTFYIFILSRYHGQSVKELMEKCGSGRASKFKSRFVEEPMATHIQRYLFHPSIHLWHPAAGLLPWRLQACIEVELVQLAAPVSKQSQVSAMGTTTSKTSCKHWCKSWQVLEACLF